MATRITGPEQLKELLGIPFTPEQLACITAPLAPQVIVAGAGSGKTTVMAARVVWLVGTGQVAPDRVLGLTFTNKAAGELSERVRKALLKAGITDPDPHPADPNPTPDHVPGDPQISTYHAFAGQLLKEHGMRIGLEPSARLLADATRFQLAARVLRSAPGPYPALTKGIPALVSDLLGLEGELAEHLVAPDRLRTHDTGLAERLGALDPAKRGFAWVRDVRKATQGRLDLAALATAYRAEKKRRDLLDFGDQIALSATLARTRPEVGRILREQYAVVLLDEYQDTSVAQGLLLAGLFGGGTGHPVTAVGDPCQAIYGWRGASVANLDDFPAHFPHADGAPARRFSLSENRRSGGRLLDLANGLAAELRARHEGVEALRPAPGAERDGVVRCALLPTQADEIAWIADRVAHLVRTGTPPAEIAVLCRATSHFADIHAALVARDVPVEVVGLSGLLHLPEVADLVAVCEVLHDPTANAALVRLLIGPRWRIGPRDLALLGRRARLLVSYGHDGDGNDRLAAAVEGTDPAEVISLADALETFLGDEPDDALPFSPEARVRFARLAAEIRDLRRALADPLMDVLHRVLAVTGLEVELSASPHALAARRRETLNAFLDIAAGFASLDGEATLLAFLGFLRTAAEYEKGLDSSLPGGENTVKVLTAHKSKGLEWDVVAVPGLVRKGFPSERGRELWPANAKVLPHALRGDAATLPDVEEWSREGLDAFKAAMAEHNRIEELRLGYVTFTRPRSLLLGSGHWWGPTQKRPFGPSAFLDALRAHCEAGYGEIDVWADPPAEDAENPALESPADHAWPLPLDPDALERRRHAARTVLAYLNAPPEASDSRAYADAPDPDWPPPPEEDEPPGEEEGDWDDWYADVAEGAKPGHGLAHVPAQAPSPDAARPAEPPEGRRDDKRPPRPGPAAPAGSDPAAPMDAGGLLPEESRLVTSWDRDLDALAGELRRSRATVRDVPVPPVLTASQLMRLAADPNGFARELARPMPRPPQRAARRGTRFHAWVESRFEELPLIAPEELPGIEGDDEIEDERDLAALKDAFLRTPYAERAPYRVEAPFQLRLAGRVIRGRIDAVYREDDGTYEIVDWKTNRSPSADPLQLAVYRLAWAERQEVPLEQVTAAFLYVRTGDIVRPPDLPDRRSLERLLLGRPDPSDQLDRSHQPHQLHQRPPAD